LSDQPLRIADWQPRNFDGKFRGEVSLSEAMIDSINVPFVRLAQQVGIRNVASTARQLGITSPIRQDLSSALGSSEVTLLELAQAYAIIAQKGRNSPPYGIVRITGQGGRLLYQHSSPSITVSLSPTALQGVDGMLVDAVNRGTGRNAALRIRAAGKTGTSQGFRDAWFIGYAGGVTTGVWFGNDDASPMVGATGGRFAAAAWRSYMQHAINP
jgi:penicillin-binding protein 1A